MARKKQAAGSHTSLIGGAGGGGGGEGSSQKKQKKPQNTNKQSAKQRIRAEAAERSRLSRKANQALQRRVEREEASTAATTENSEKSTTLPAASRAEQREAVQQDVEARLSIWRRKRARAEAGLPVDPVDDDDNAPERRRTPERASVFPTAYYPEQGNGSGGGGGGGRALAGGALPGRNRATADACWPELYNAPVRRCLPGRGRGMLGSSASPASPPGGTNGGGCGGFGARKKRKNEEADREAEERWEAPWMLGLVGRCPREDGGGGSGGGGSCSEPFDLIGSDDRNCPVEEGMHAGEAVERQDSEGRNASTVRDASAVAVHGTALSYGDAAAAAAAAAAASPAAGNEARHAGAVRSEWGAGEDGREGGGPAPASADEGLSDLHHELLRFEEYVSLTPAEVAARESLVASIKASAREALGYGATARAFGSYGGGRVQPQSACFSIFLSDVDISVRPPAGSGEHPSKTRPPRVRNTLGGVLDLSRGSDDGFEEGSSSSSSCSSSSTSSSWHGSASDSEPGSDSGNSRPLRPTRAVSAAAAASSAAADAAGTAACGAIYVASSGSEIDDDNQERSPGNRTRVTMARSRNSVGATAVPPLYDAAAAAAAAEPEAPACSGAVVGEQGGDGGGGVRGGGTAGPSEKAGKEQQVGSDTGGPQAAADAQALGFYVDRRPDPELLKLVAREREAADGRASGERSAQGRNGGEGSSSSIGSCSGSGGGGIGGGDRAATEPKPVSSGHGKKPEPVEEAPQTRREAPRAGDSAFCEGDSTARVACDSPPSSSTKGNAKGKGKKRPRSSSSSSMRGLASPGSVGIGGGGDGGGGGGGKNLSIEASDGDGGGGEGEGRLEAVFKPDGGGWIFVKGKEEGSRNNADAQDGGTEEEGEDGETKKSAMSSSAQRGGSGDGGEPATPLDDTAAAASGAGDADARLAERLRAQSERTARLTADAATLAAKLSSAQPDGTPAAICTAAPPSRPSWHLTFKADGGSADSGGGGGDDVPSSGPETPDQAEDSVAASRRGGDTKGDGVGVHGDEKGDKDGEKEQEGGEGEEDEEEGREGKHADGLMALVREQERRNGGRSLPSAFLATAYGQGEGSSGESSRAAKLQAALTVAARAVAARAAAKRRLPGGTVAPPGGALEIRARAEPVNGWRGGGAVAGVPWRGGNGGGKARAVAGLRKLGKCLLKMPWVAKFEFRSRARVPIIAMVDARRGVECDVGWGKDDGWDDPGDAPGPAYFAEMFRGAFRPLAFFLKVFMRQRGLDKPFTGGLGSFKLYALIAAHLQACGCGSAPRQLDLGDLLLGFFHRYSPATKERVSQATVLRIKGLTIDLGSAFRAFTISEEFGRAFEALYSATVEEADANGAGNSAGTAATPVAVPGRPGARSDAACRDGGLKGSGDSHLNEGTKEEKRSADNEGKGNDYSSNSGSMDDDDRGSDVGSQPRQAERQDGVHHRSRRRVSVLGKVIWGSDLRRERESRLAAAGCAMTSPHPACQEPRWHAMLEAAYQGQFSRGFTPRGPRPTGGPSKRGLRDAKGRGGGGGRGGSAGKRWEAPFWWADVQKPNKPAWTKAQKKRAKLKRDAEEIEMRKRKKRRGPNSQATAAGAKSKKRKGASTSGNDAAAVGSARKDVLRSRKKSKNSKQPGS